MSAYGSGSGPEYLDGPEHDLERVGRRLRLRGRLRWWPMGPTPEEEAERDAQLDADERLDEREDRDGIRH